jgi:hypothetical protein
VFLDSKSKVSSGWEASRFQFVILYFQSSGQ